MSHIQSPIPLEPQALLCAESLFSVANGYVGLRAAFEEGYPEGVPSVRGLYANGFYDIVDMKQAEPLYGLVDKKQTIVNLADVQGMELFADGQRFSMFDGKITDSRWELDFDTGTCNRHVVWHTSTGGEFEIEIRRMASFVHPSILTIDYQVTPRKKAASLRLISRHEGDVRNYSDPDDPRLASHSVQNLSVNEVTQLNCCGNAISSITSQTSRSGLGVCTAAGHQVYPAGRSRCETTATGAVHTFESEVPKGTTLRIVKIIAVCDSLRHGKSFAGCAAEELERVMTDGIDILYDRQADYLKRFWRQSAVTVKESSGISEAIRYNQFALLQSAGRDIYANVAAKGLSGEGYEGHYFWDTEMYLQPVFLLTMPELCRNLIGFRYRTLDQARENARALGHARGALYPWRTINGEECSGYFVSGTAAYHINGAVANAVEQYWLATGDDDFLAEMGAEMVLEIARLWLDTGHFSGGEFRIHSVTGPDEYTCMVDNNYYTNALARKNLRFAVRAAGMIGPEQMHRLGTDAAELACFTEAAEAMRLPYDEELGIHAQDDSFLKKPRWDLAATPAKNHPLLLHYHPLTLYRHQVCKQADTVMAYFVCDMTPDNIMARSFSYYEEITTHDSSLSRCMFSIVAAMLGDVEKAGSYLADTIGLDLHDSHGNTKDGIHTANMGGSYMALVYGLAGLRFKADGLYLRPLLPKAWQGYSFRLVYRGALAEVSVDQNGCCCRFLEGSANIVIEEGKGSEKYVSSNYI